MIKNKRAIFLDRDGVINKKAEEGDYIKSWEEFEFLPGVVEAMKTFCENNWEIYIITNQAGVGKGLMKKEDLDLIHKNMQSELLKNGVKINDIYCCPHVSGDNCSCRKPNPGMLLMAAKNHGIDLKTAVFAGDSEKDIKAGMAVGCKTILIDKNKSLLDITKELF
jgi:histidinol-phosphate phosphatase family protein